MVRLLPESCPSNRAADARATVSNAVSPPIETTKISTVPPAIALHANRRRGQICQPVPELEFPVERWYLVRTRSRAP